MKTKEVLELIVLIIVVVVLLKIAGFGADLFGWVGSIGGAIGGWWALKKTRKEGKTNADKIISGGPDATADASSDWMRRRKSGQ